ncbi:Multidrug resistance protein MdtA precursor [Pigmentiphaga humi]|uniref:Multidrug resistance protein MdtA n=1 Tax=Pigmentiphaga humi TaxID=2478468 RepID=A0A3P4AW93_9BURK|nr:efflux RND transporter periplasmic adaptor subunit [Pigmentiphaga humi]VCU68293.1 Multidrug resistance protein MdtA precursor [Pigmentiphaga humi]
MTEQRHAMLGIHPLETPPGEEHELLRRKQVARRARLLAGVVVVLLLIGGGRTVLSRRANAIELEQNAAELAHQYVQVVSPSAGQGDQTLMLPGTLQGFVQSPISARASGYLKRWTKDIGSRVNKGEVLAEIETPEIDQQLSQAAAARQQAQASFDFAQSTLRRWEGLRQKDVVSQQDLEERRSAAEQSRANLAAAQANEQRLRQLEDFKRVVAPFSGVITRRNVDVGDLIDAGGGVGKTLFMLSQTDPLRIYVNVPQAYAQLVKVGAPVEVTQSELPGRVFKGAIARTASAIDATTRTMQIEVSLPNKEGTLLPGAYVRVALKMAPSQALTVPSNTLLLRAEGPRVGVVDDQGVVRLAPVALGRNFGQRQEILDGLTASDRVVLNPADSLADGDKVVLAQPKERQ